MQQSSRSIPHEMRCQIDHEFVDESRGDRCPGEGRAGLDQDLVHTGLGQVPEDCSKIDFITVILPQQRGTGRHECIGQGAGSVLAVSVDPGSNGYFNGDETPLGQALLARLRQCRDVELIAPATADSMWA